MNNVQENIKAWLDGELDTAQSQQVSEAIANDPEIAKMADFYRLLSDEIRTVAVQPEVHGASKVLEMVHGKVLANFDLG
jgi:anti-sigma factor RsiW